MIKFSGSTHSRTPLLTRLKKSLLDEHGRPTPGAIALVAANMVPVAGVLLFGWTVGVVMIIFWLENVVIGVFNVARMITSAKGGILNHASKFFVVPFFTVHYGGFTFVHGLFVLILFASPMLEGVEPTENLNGAAADEIARPVQEITLPEDGELDDEEWERLIANMDGESGEGADIEEIAAIFFHTVVRSGLWIAVVALVISHGVSFFSNYIGKGEYRTVTAHDLMARPYGRVVVLHIVIIFGAVLVVATGQPVAALLLLVLLKIGIDLAAHAQERGVMSAGRGAGT